VHVEDVGVGFARVQQRRQRVTRVEEKFAGAQQHGGHVGDELRRATPRRPRVTVSPRKVRQRRFQHRAEYQPTDPWRTIRRKVRLKAKHIEIPCLDVDRATLTLSKYTYYINKTLIFSTIHN